MFVAVLRNATCRPSGVIRGEWDPPINIAGAVEAIRAGAVDYLVKPFDLEELPIRFAQAKRVQQSKRADEYRRGQEAEQGQRRLEHRPVPYRCRQHDDRCRRNRTGHLPDRRL